MRWVGHIAWTGVEENAYSFMMAKMDLKE